ncbi:MAG: hypothetical protein WDM90_22475 [Ferruginibacter sp.]
MQNYVRKKKLYLCLVFLVFLVILNLKPINTFAQICTTTSFAKYFGKAWRGQGGFFEQTADTGFIFGLIQDERRKVITKVDVNANIIWSKVYDYAGSTNLLNTYEYCSGVVDNDGNYFIDMQSYALALLNPQGSIISIKKLKTLNSTVANGGPVHNLIVLPDNKKLVLVQDYSGGDYYMAIIIVMLLSVYLPICQPCYGQNI